MHREHIARANHPKELDVKHRRITWAIKQMSVFHRNVAQQNL